MTSKQVPLFDVSVENYINIEIAPFSESSSDSNLQNEESYLTFHFDKLGNLIPSDRFTRHQIIQSNLCHKQLRRLTFKKRNHHRREESHKAKGTTGEVPIFDPVEDYFNLEIDSSFSTHSSFDFDSEECIIFRFDEHGNILPPDGSTPTLSNNARSPSTLGPSIIPSFTTTDLKLPSAKAAANPSVEAGSGADAPKTTLSQEVKETTKLFCLIQKLKALRDHLKALFTKSKKHKKYAASAMHSINTNVDEGGSKNRTSRCRSFLSMFKRRCSAKVSSLSTTSSSSFSSYIEAERSIEEVIAYCKETHEKCGTQEKAAAAKVDPNDE
ncbi:hypothetical protein RIF29_40059 [Crotalaria pallida]|uniref:Uncharacterized protein n=1 Tax=Crotalaria pallida TaxID=3830 RepID=A0AAN9E2E4_CROPI